MRDKNIKKTHFTKGIKMFKADRLVQDGSVWIGGKRFIDVALWQDGTVTIATGENGETGEDTRFQSDSVQARIVYAIIATKEGE